MLNKRESYAMKQNVTLDGDLIFSFDFLYLDILFKVNRAIINVTMS